MFVSFTFCELKSYRFSVVNKKSYVFILNKKKTNQKYGLKYSYYITTRAGKKILKLIFMLIYKFIYIALYCVVFIIVL